MISTIADLKLRLYTDVVCVLIADFYIGTLFMQGCVFHYKREDAIKQRQHLTDALYDVLTTGKHAGSE